MKDRGMMKWVPCPWRTATVLALVLALGIGTASAKKPVKPPPPDPEPTMTGTIVYARGDVFSEMNPDGSDPTPLYFDADFTDGSDIRAAVSRERHNGKLWLLQSHPVGTGVHPDGDAHRELFVIGEGDTDAVQLTANASMEFSFYQMSVAWGPEDDFVSWVAHTWAVDPDTGDDYVAEAGIYAAPLLYSADGDILGLADDPVLVVETDTFTIWNDVVVTEVRYGLDWSPDGTKVLWHHADTEDGPSTLRITDISDPTTSTLLTSTTARFCGVWSSQDEIAWIGGGVRRILADGSGEETLYTARKNESLSFLTWSPDGEHLAYVSDGNKVVIYTLAVDDASRSSTGAKGRPKRWLAE